MSEGEERTKRSSSTRKGAMTVEEAGRKGGEKVASERGSEFYSEIGKKGGKIGGEKTAETHGREFYSDIGHKGGQKVKKLVEEGKEHEQE